MKASLMVPDIGHIDYAAWKAGLAIYGLPKWYQMK